MQIVNQSFYQKMICDAHNECQERIYGVRNTNPAALIFKNKVIIISGKDGMTASGTRISIRGRRFDHTLRDMRHEHYSLAMKAKLAEITGHAVCALQTEISLNDGERAEVYCLEHELLTF